MRENETCLFAFVLTLDTLPFCFHSSFRPHIRYKHTMFLVQFVVSLRISNEDMEISDEAAHNEEAYVIWGQGEKFDKLRHEGPIWPTSSNNNFYILNNITHFFTHTYSKKF